MAEPIYVMAKDEIFLSNMGITLKRGEIAELQNGESPNHINLIQIPEDRTIGKFIHKAAFVKTPGQGLRKGAAASQLAAGSRALGEAEETPEEIEAQVAAATRQAQVELGLVDESPPVIKKPKVPATGEAALRRKKQALKKRRTGK